MTNQKTLPPIFGGIKKVLDFFTKSSVSMGFILTAIVLACVLSFYRTDPQVIALVQFTQPAFDLFKNGVTYLAMVFIPLAIGISGAKALIERGFWVYVRTIGQYLLMASMAVTLGISILGWQPMVSALSPSLELSIFGELVENFLATATPVAADNTQTIAERMFASPLIQAVFLGLVISFSVWGYSLLRVRNKAPKFYQDSWLIWPDKVKSIVLHALKYFVALIAPVAVFSALSTALKDEGLAVLLRYLLPIVCVFIALVIQCIALYIFQLVMTRHNPMVLLKTGMPAIIRAFGTSSSKAAIDLAIDAVVKRGVNRDFAEFQTVVGTSFNMDGTAIYMSSITVLMAMALGVPLDFADYITVVILSLFYSMGAAGIPSGSLIFLGFIFEAVGIPPAAVLVIIPIDPVVLDRMRTTVNIYGDMVGAYVRGVREGMMDSNPSH